mmetsp:Transcript_5369/g.11685  ORF Transcript_5369/g.11685 Transcript_5369/m.11685 type:complete len:815 (-) Transcript_5369:539-2983(-)|eukprot:CAMPEP_0206537736 /NCGR_PEP_ID=MMETSP0325_2-20121206/7477_1 /ASSEMBLY_ACC=CAM_ASM_000347 /TAXON_ID=2866 /ORGANISM="Crypthecodinium cohnii, Strain Seligo" /LENGTH=814 /DNA_ID=CAMNT_0054035105 /DNA_START=207 /DNA_END=2651 /DNA_ORIENTATION=+
MAPPAKAADKVQTQPSTTSVIEEEAQKNTKAALRRLEAVEAEAALREELVQEDDSKVDFVLLRRLYEDARAKGASRWILKSAEDRLGKWDQLQEFLREKHKGIPTWRVVNPDGHVNIRSSTTVTASVMGRKEQGAIVRGYPDGDWIRLDEEHNPQGFMLTKKPDGTVLVEPYDGQAKDEDIRPSWLSRLLKLDRLCREGFTFLRPEFHHHELMVENMDSIGQRVLEIGQSLYKNGTMPCNPLWEIEESPEFVESLSYWEEAIDAACAEEFDVLVQKAASLAHEGYIQMGNLAPRLASLRWNCCLTWIASRSTAAMEVSTGGCFGTLKPARSKEICHDTKHQIFELLRPLTKEYPVMAIFDHDLVGHGVWHDSKREPLPKRAHDHWYRRCMEFDITKLCHQACQVPPEDMNASAATLVMVQPYLTPDWVLSPYEAPRHILEKHDWYCDAIEAEIDDLHTKAWVNGLVVHIERAPEFQHDFDDPEVRAKVERGEDLGKGLQEDNLPGSIHGSVALLYATMLAVDEVQHLHIYPGILEIESFFETLLRYGPPLLSLSLEGSGDSLTEELISQIKLAGAKLTILNLSDCKLCDDHIETLVEMLEHLPNLKHIDLSHNELNEQAALDIITTMCDRRIDVPSIRFDGNPIDGAEDFRDEVGLALARRGQQVVAGGELVLHMENNMIRWYPAPREGQLAERFRSDNFPKMIALKDIRVIANKASRSLDEYERNNPAAQSSGGREWLARKREANQRVLDSPLLMLYRRELQARVREKEEQEARKESLEATASKAFNREEANLTQEMRDAAAALRTAEGPPQA